MLLEAGCKYHGIICQLDSVDDANRTTLSRACEGGHVEVVKLLLEKGARHEVHEVDEDSSSCYSRARSMPIPQEQPLVVASKAGNVELVSGEVCLSRAVRSGWPVSLTCPSVRWPGLLVDPGEHAPRASLERPRGGRQPSGGLQELACGGRDHSATEAEEGEHGRLRVRDARGRGAREHGALHGAGDQCGEQCGSDGSMPVGGRPHRLQGEAGT